MLKVAYFFKDIMLSIDNLKYSTCKSIAKHPQVVLS